MVLHLVVGDEHGLSVIEIEVPRKVSDFNREEVANEWNKSCMNGDFMIFPPSTNIIPCIIIYI
jgi:hypothetical protein